MCTSRLSLVGAGALSAAALMTGSALPAGAQVVAPPTGPVVNHVQQCAGLFGSGLCASDITVFAGQTATLTHIPPVTGGSNTGNWTFASSACAGYSDGDLNPPSPPEFGTCGFSVGDGTYASQVCGTGVASGDSNITASTIVGEAEGGATVSFTIYFNAGVGVIEGTVTAGTEDLGANVLGVVLISAVPIIDGDCVVTGVNTFRAIGAAGAAEPATGS